jgi:hypothetical protein
MKIGINIFNFLKGKYSGSEANTNMEITPKSSLNLNDKLGIPDNRDSKKIETIKNFRKRTN